VKPRFLLDEQLSLRLAEAAGRAGLDVTAVSGSDLEGVDDRTVLLAAAAQERILVTYDIRDFSRLMRDLVSGGVTPRGMLLIHPKSFRPDDLRGIRRALISMADRIERGEVNPSMGEALTK
jgi:predicted nuclease of predicted toxin-antitoxin system